VQIGFKDLIAAKHFWPLNSAILAAETFTNCKIAPLECLLIEVLDDRLLINSVHSLALD